MSPTSAGKHLSTDEELRQLLVDASVRVTAQRLGLARLLFEGPHRHVVASKLHEECAREGLSVSLATVYNSLRQFVQAGLLREVSVNADSSFFDTNTGPHGHAFDETTQTLSDVPLPELSLPQGIDPAELESVDVIYRLRSVPI